MNKAKKIINIIENDKNLIYARYLYQPVGMGSPSTWHFLKSIPALNTSEGHDRLVKEWNWRDRGKEVWRWEEVEKKDIDYPQD